MTNSVFDAENYRDFLKKTIEASERGMVKRLANAAGCQRSYLSQALNSHVNLIADHLYGIGKFLQLSEHELDYLLLLLEKERASSASYQECIQSKLNVAKEKNKRISKRVKKTISSQISDKYYSTWYYAALHIATSIGTLETEIDFSKYLCLSKNLVGQVLRELESWGLVSYSNNCWDYAGPTEVHLSDKSLLNRMNHLNWRTQALARPLEPYKDVHYTSVFAASKEDLKILRDELISHIERQRKTIEKSEAEEVASFCCDLFSLD